MFDVSIMTTTGETKRFLCEEIVYQDPHPTRPGRKLLEFKELKEVNENEILIIEEEFLKNAETIITFATDGEDLPLPPVLNLAFEKSTEEELEFNTETKEVDLSDLDLEGN